MNKQFLPMYWSALPRFLNESNTFSHNDVEVFRIFVKVS